MGCARQPASPVGSMEPSSFRDSPALGPQKAHSTALKKARGRGPTWLSAEGGMLYQRLVGRWHRQPWSPEPVPDQGGWTGVLLPSDPESSPQKPGLAPHRGASGGSAPPCL